MLPQMLLLLALSTGADKPEAALCGRWDYAKNDQTYYRFFPDGTFKFVTPTETLLGAYRVLSGGVFELLYHEQADQFGPRKQVEYKYKVMGDTLKIKVGGQWVTYKRPLPEEPD